MATVGIRDMKDWIHSSTLDITPTHLVGNVSYTQMSNDETKNIHFGSACSSKIEFEIQDFNNKIASLSGAELIYEKLVESEQRTLNYKLSTVQITTASLLYTSLATAPYIQILNLDGEPVGNIPSAAATKVDLFVISGGYLYALHRTGPYITKYLISGQNLVIQSRPVLSEMQIEQIGRYIINGLSMRVDTNSIKYYETKLYNGMAQSLIERTYTRVPMGYFICDKPSRVNDTKHKVVAYDRMSKFDKDASAWIDSRTYPITIRNLQIQLCSFCGVPFDNERFTNDTYSVQQNFTGENITARQVQQWIAEAAGGFAIIDRQGRLGVKQYQTPGMTLTSSEYTKAEMAEYSITKIGQVTVRVSEEDVGVAVPATGGTNPYVIQNNPLLYATSDAQLRPAVTNIYNAVQGIVYTPGSVTAFADPAIDTGSFITVVSGGKNQTFALMQCVWKGNVATYSGYGERDLSNVAPANIQITALNRKTNTLTRTLDETKSELADVEGNVSTLTQTVSGISTTVQDQNGKISTLEQTSTSLTATVGGLKDAQDATKLTFDSTGLTIKNGGFRIENSSGQSTFSVNGTTGEISATGTFTSQNQAAGRMCRLTAGGLTFFSGSTNVGSMYFSSTTGLSVVSVDYVNVRIGGQDYTSAGRFYYNSMLGGTKLEVTQIDVSRVDLDILNGKTASWATTQPAGSQILVGW